MTSILLHRFDVVLPSTTTSVQSSSRLNSKTRPIRRWVTSGLSLHSSACDLRELPFSARWELNILFEEFLEEWGKTAGGRLGGRRSERTKQRRPSQRAIGFLGLGRRGGEGAKGRSVGSKFDTLLNFLARTRMDGFNRSIHWVTDLKALEVVMDDGNMFES
ncbi:unnamed protein product [Calypogeia fissa]